MELFFERRSWLSNLSTCRLSFTSACSVELNNECYKQSSRQLRTVAADVSLAMLARESNTSKTTTRNALARAVSIGLLEKIERRSYCAVSLPNILTYGEAMMVARAKATHDLRSLEAA